MIRVLICALAAFGLAACAGPGLCERQARVLTTKCAGRLAVFPNPSCEAQIENCSPGQKAQMDGYVGCLEAARECSLESMRACQERYPGGVNLQC